MEWFIVTRARGVDGLFTNRDHPGASPEKRPKVKWSPRRSLVTRLGLFALLGFAAGSLLTAAPKIGDRAPEIHFDKLLPEQPAANATFEALAGKTVVLDMWATWCGSCVAAIPHLNELAEKFKDRPVVFLSVTDEQPAVVEAFLKKRPISGLVGVAHTDSPMQRYGVEALSTTFLIDATGKIAGSIDLERVNASMIEDLVAGRPLPPIDLMIRPHSNSNSVATWTGRNSLVMHGLTLQSIISHLWGIQRSRMTGEPLHDYTMYDLSLSIPGATPANFRSWARDVVAAAFHLKVNRETRETEVWILAKNEVKPVTLLEPALNADSTAFYGWRPALPPSAGGLLNLAYSTVSYIAEFIESAVKKPVLDETGITGKYDFHMSYDKADPEGSIEAMRKAGFKVEPARRTIEFLVVTRAE
jgi:uncharacterized protein (TIGR03435 family)